MEVTYFDEDVTSWVNGFRTGSTNATLSHIVLSALSTNPVNLGQYSIIAETLVKSQFVFMERIHGAAYVSEFALNTSVLTLPLAQRHQAISITKETRAMVSVPANGTLVLAMTFVDNSDTSKSYELARR